PRAARAQQASTPVVGLLTTRSPDEAATHRAAFLTVPIVVVALPSSNRFPDLCASVARPGGSVTGFSHLGSDLAPKRVEILKEAVPSLANIAVLHATTDPIYEEWAAETETSAKAQGLKTIRLALSSSSAEPLAALMQSGRAAGATGVIVIRDFLTETLRGEIVNAANAEHMATVAEHRSFAESGALLSYGANLPDLFRRAAAYVDQILKGARAGELPIQLPTKFELVVNVKTAHLLGLTIPPTLFARADEVIE
ncbi:MAG TPA: ABC transporter substrate-binding protein, partial [Sphingomicrobium sp.]|nr:ABC transporter substrate-binding protein [Sphingomicrobium sp.]